MKKHTHAAASLVALMAAVGLPALHGCTNSESRETPGEKAEWTVLQAIELKNRANPVVAPILQTVGEHEVLGLRSTNGQNVWILLKPTSPPYYKQMPSENYVVPAELLQKLISEHRVSYTVETVLESRVTKP